MTEPQLEIMECYVNVMVKSIKYRILRELSNTLDTHLRPLFEFKQQVVLHQKYSLQVENQEIGTLADAAKFSEKFCLNSGVA